MAENQRKIADPIDINDDDPFAELTRIMGFDPRLSVPSQPREIFGANSSGPAVVTPLAPKTAPVVSEPAAHDDFSIDLEKELLGSFSDFDLPAEVAAPSAQGSVESAFDRAFAEAVDPMEAELAAAAESALGDDLFEQSVADGIAGHGEEPAAVTGYGEEPAAIAEPLLADDAFDDAIAASLDGEARQPAASLEPVLADDAFDDAIAAELGAYSDQPAFAGEAAVEPVAEVDPFDDAVVADLTAAAAEAADEHPMPEFDLEDFDLQPDPHEAAPVSQAHAEAAGDPIDAFAEVDMDFSAAFDRQFAADAAAVETAAQAEAAQPQAASAGHVELSLEDELDALLERSRARARTPVEPVAAAPAPDRGGLPFLSDPRWAAAEADVEDESVDSRSNLERAAAFVDRPIAPLADLRRPFGDPALTGRHANFQVPTAPAAQPAAEDLDDLLDAMEHDVHAAEQPSAPADEEQRVSEHAAPAVQSYAYDDDTVAAAATPALDEGGEEQVPEYGYAGAPDIETVDVPEAAVAVADDLDIPELAYEQDQRQLAYDDIEADFAASFNETAPSEEPVSQATRGAARPVEQADFDAEFEALYGPAFGQAAAARPAAAEQGYYQSFASGETQAEQADDEYEEFASTDASAAAAGDRYVDLYFDGDLEEEIEPAVAARQAAERPQRRGLLVAAVVGGVALLGGVGALALTFGSGDGADTPVVVKADDGPVKVKPENPGGTAFPNQDNKVYDAVKGTAAAAPDKPLQEKLVTTAEEPVDMAAVDQAEALPGVQNVEDIIAKSEERIDPVTETDQDQVATESIAVAPRKVRTMVVRSDGTLVPREEGAMAAASDETSAVAAAAEDGPAFQSPGSGDPVPVKTVKSTKVDADGKTAAALAPTTVASTKVDAAGNPRPETTESALPPANLADEDAALPAPAAAEPEPAEAAAAQPAPAQPVQEAKPEVVASAEPEPTAVATGAWSVQIASQPSAESAKSTYQDLANRFSSVIGGRGVNIVKAEIDGKGTYWRVRVPAKSRNDAVKLCTDYKAAGGNCFVSK